MRRYELQRNSGLLLALCAGLLLLSACALVEGGEETQPQGAYKVYYAVTGEQATVQVVDWEYRVPSGEDTASALAELVLSASESLERVEAILETALPEIGSRMDRIISGPVYRGVFEMNGSFANVNEPAMLLHIEAECRHADVYAVRCYLNRELVLLCEREHIRRL